MSIDSTKRYHFTGADATFAMSYAGPTGAKYVGVFDLCANSRADVTQDLPMPALIDLTNAFTVKDFYCYDSVQRTISVHAALPQLHTFAIPPRGGKITVRFSFTNVDGDYLTPMLVYSDVGGLTDITHIGSTVTGRHVDSVLSIDLPTSTVARVLVPVLVLERSSVGIIRIADLYLTYEYEGKL